MPIHKIDGFKCKMVIDELTGVKRENSEWIILLRAELKIAKRLKMLYVKEMLKWADRENKLIVRILKIESNLRA